jgi:hypothetical protein
LYFSPRMLCSAVNESATMRDGMTLDLRPRVSTVRLTLPMPSGVDNPDAFSRRTAGVQLCKIRSALFVSCIIWPRYRSAAGTMSPETPRTVDTTLEARPIAWRRLESERALDLTQSALEYHYAMSINSHPHPMW